MTSKITANIIGATGLVGKQLTKQLLDNDKFEKVRIFTRRDTGIKHKKLEQHIVVFEDEKTWNNLLSGDVFFSALGTTLKQAGGKKQQYKIDYTLNYQFAGMAKEKGIENYVLISSIGANAKSKLFYPRMKGELDNAIAKIGFKRYTIIRPGPLTGDREIKRPMEIISFPVLNFITKFSFKKYSPIKDSTVARAMINAVLYPNPEKTIYEGMEVFSLAEKHK